MMDTQGLIAFSHKFSNQKDSTIKKREEKNNKKIIVFFDIRICFIEWIDTLIIVLRFIDFLRPYFSVFKLICNSY